MKSRLNSSKKVKNTIVKYVPRILNILLISFVTGLCGTLIARYWLPFGYSVAIGVLIGLSFAALLCLFGHSGGGKKRAEKHAASVRTAILTMDKTKRKRFFAEIFSMQYPTVADESGWTVTKGGESEFILDALRYSTFSGDDVVAARAERKDGKIVVLTDCFDSGAVEAASVLNVEILSWKKVYALLDKARAYPRLHPRQKPKGQMRKLLAVAVHPRRTKAYLLTAFVLLTTSIITPFRFYYLLLAGLCCMLAGAAFADPFRSKDVN